MPTIGTRLRCKRDHACSSRLLRVMDPSSLSRSEGGFVDAVTGEIRRALGEGERESGGYHELWCGTPTAGGGGET